jgi:hypothetical protein
MRPSVLCLPVLSVHFCTYFCSDSSAHAQNRITPPPGLVSWWRAESDAMDAAGLNNGVGYDLGFTNGIVGTAFHFTGSGDDYVGLPWNLFPMPSSGPGTNAYSFDVWFRTIDRGVIIGQQDVPPFDTPLGGYVPALYVGTNGLLFASFFWGTGDQLMTTNTVNDGKFHHTAVTFDGANQVLYLDGRPASSDSFVQTGYAALYAYQLGTGFTGGWAATPGGWFPFIGEVDEPSAWARALTPEEVAALYNAGSAGKCVAMARPLLLHRYGFNQAAGTRTVVDSATAADASLLYAAPSAPYTNGVPDGSAFTGTGMLDLAGSTGFVAFPSLLISPLSSLTFELWLTWNGNLASPPQRILQFGVTVPGGIVGPGPAFVALSTSQASSNALTIEVTGFSGTEVSTATNSIMLSGPAMPVGRKVFIAVTYDPVDGLSQLYVEGVKAAEVRTNLLQTLDQFSGAGTWLGRSHQTSGGFLHAELDEFRVWEGALPDWEIAAHFAAGPDQLLPVYPPPLTARRSGKDLQLRWRADISTGLGLQASENVSPPQWSTVDQAPVLTNAWNQVTVSPTNRHGFYRLSH